MFTSLTVAIRSYWQIHCLEANRRGLELIVAASTELSRPRGLIRFAEGVVTQLCALLGVAEEGIVCAAGGTASSEPYILAAAGCYSEWIGVTLPGVSDGPISDLSRCSSCPPLPSPPLQSDLACTRCCLS